MGALIGAHYIVRIGGLNTRPTRRWHEIDYVHGTEAHSTTATEDGVAEFLESNDEDYT
jgi:hypothetical protein